MGLSRLFVVALCVATPLAAQSLPPDEVRARSRPYVPPTPAGALRAEVSLVEVPVVVRDGKRRAVPGLQQSDFEIYDAGKKQTITAFTVETFTADGGFRKADPAAPASSPTPDARKTRYVVICFDNLSTAFDELKLIKDAAMRFVRTGLAPGDLVAIVTTASSHNTAFTTDVEKLVESIRAINVQQRFRDGQSNCPRITGYQAYVIVNHLDSQVFDGVVDEDMACKQLQRRVAMEDVNSLARAVWEEARANSLNTINSIRSIVDALGKLPGQRMLLLASSGFLMGNLETEEDELVSRAVRAEVVINALDAKGLATYSAGRPIDAAPVQGRSGRTQIAEASIQGRQALAKDDGMAVLALGTGGHFYHNSNNLDQGFRELGTLPEIVYVLGFSPADVTPDGRYHRLKVKLARGRHSLQARMGYTAPSGKAAAPPPPPSRLDLALTASDAPADLAAKITPEPVAAQGGIPKLDVWVTIDISRLRFETRSERRVQKLSFLSALLDQGGNFVSGTQGEVDMALKPDTFDRLVQQGGFNVRLPLQAAPGAYTVRTVIVDGLDGKMTAASHPVELR